MNDMLMAAVQLSAGRFQPQGNASAQTDPSLTGQGGFYQLMQQKTVSSMDLAQLLPLQEELTEGDTLLQELAAALMMPSVPAQMQTPQQPQQQPMPTVPVATQPVAVAMVPAEAAQQVAPQQVAATVVQDAPPMQTAPLMTDKAATPRADVLPTQNTTMQDAVVQTAATQTDQDTPDLLDGSKMAGKPLFQNTENTPIKVGDPAPVDTQSPDFDAQLTRQLSKSLQNGDQTLKLKLAPEGLGEVVVEFTRSKDGAVQVLLQTSTETATNLLRSHSAELSSLLRSNNQAPVLVEVQQQQQNSYTQQEQQQQKNQQQQQQEQQQQQQNQQRQSSQDFVEQLRLGLVPMQFEAS